MDKFIKRLFDITVSVLLLTIFSPVFVVIAMLVRLFLGSPVIFMQQRPGFKCIPFIMYKFRTMNDVYDQQGNLLPAGERLTRFGSLLRSTSLDELPELFNVLKGDMSLVGPRPLVMKYLGRYTQEQNRRHDVMPGITGWAQVNGRNALNWDEKFKLDVWYVDHCSLWLDIKILFMTVIVALKRDGISAEGHTTSPEFLGSKGS